MEHTIRKKGGKRTKGTNHETLLQSKLVCNMRAVPCQADEKKVGKEVGWLGDPLGPLVFLFAPVQRALRGGRQAAGQASVSSSEAAGGVEVRQRGAYQVMSPQAPFGKGSSRAMKAMTGEMQREGRGEVRRGKARRARRARSVVVGSFFLLSFVLPPGRGTCGQAVAGWWEPGSMCGPSLLRHNTALGNGRHSGPGAGPG